MRAKCMQGETADCRIGLPRAATVGKSWRTQYGGAPAPLLFREQLLWQADIRQASLVRKHKGKADAVVNWGDEIYQVTYLWRHFVKKRNVHFLTLSH